MIEQINNYLFDERFYTAVEGKERVWRPSITYLLGAAMPTEYGLINWRGDIGNKRADEILEESSEDGSFVHDCIDKLIKKQTIKFEDINDRFKPNRALKIHRCIKAFIEWFEEYKPETVANEYIVWGQDYAGTVDYKCKIDGQLYIIDFKTSRSISDKHKIQIVGYERIDKDQCIPAILQLGNTTKKRYTFSVIKDMEKYEAILDSAVHMFKTVYPNAKPSEESFPDEYKL